MKLGGLEKKTTLVAMSKRILIVTTSHGALGATGKTTGYDLLQLTHPLYEFEIAGFEVTMASPDGGVVPMDENTRDVSDPLNRDYMGRASFTHQMQNTLALSDLVYGNYDAILFIGGLGALWDFPNNVSAALLTRQTYEAGGVVGAICHGTAALLGLQLSKGNALIKDRRVTGLSDVEVDAIGLSEVIPFSLEKELKRSGASYSSLSPWHRHCVIDGRIVTGQNSASARSVGEAIVKLIRQKDEGAIS
jgi:putative intracellular protease/amidase